MSSRNYIGNKPLGHRTPDATKGVNNAFAKLSTDIAQRTPRTTGGIAHTPGGKIISQKRYGPQRRSNPWKVTANGDKTISVGFGSVYSWDETSLTLREFKYFEGMIKEEYSPIEVTGAGSIYGSIPAALASFPDIQYSGTDSAGDTFDVFLNRVFPDATQDFIFSFQSIPPSNSSTFYFEIAKVDLVNDVAIVTRQIITDNPTLSSWLEAP